MKKRQIKQAILVLIVCAVIANTYAIREYNVIDLGQGYQPLGFNENNQALLLKDGMANNYINDLYLWDNQQTTRVYSTNDWIQGAYINNSGNIAAKLSQEYGNGSYSIIIENSNLVTINSVLLWDINNSGQTVQLSSGTLAGEIQTHLRNSDGSLWDCSNTNGFFTFGVAVNDLGQVTGATGDLDRENFTGFVWDSVSGKRYLSSLPGDMGALGIDINKQGEVVGYSATSMPPYGFPEDWDWNLVFWDSSGNIHDLGCKLYQLGIPVSLNDLTQIVGSFKLPDDFDFNPYFWEEESGFIEAQYLLEAESQWTITGLCQINNQEQILATASIDGQNHAVILDPVPEPATIGLMLLGMLYLKSKQLTNR